MYIKVHKVRFYNPRPRSVNNVCFDKSSANLAVSREDASIEIWDINHAPIILKYIPGIENGSVEAMVWVQGRLLSTGLGGALVEWDLEKLCIKNSAPLTGYAAWCLDVNPKGTQVAVGTEQGYVNLFCVEENNIIYEKLFDKQEGRILCCKYDKTGNILVTGSVDTIRVWNVTTGHATTRISASRRGKETIIWCLGILSDQTIISGDSYGRLCFWDGTTGDHIESFTTHKADILALAISDDEKSIYCSGVDSVIVNFIKIDVNKNKQGYQWVKNVQRHVHEHDVRALVIQDNKLLSMGADGYLTFSSYPPKWVMRVPPLLTAPRSSVSARRKLLLLRYVNHMEVWKLGSYATNEGGKVIFSCNKLENKNTIKNKNDTLEKDSVVPAISMSAKRNSKNIQLAENPLKLVSIQTKGKRQIKCCALSPDGQFIVYSTDGNIRMLKLEMDDEEDRSASLSKILISGLTVSSCERAVFSDDSSLLFLHSAGNIAILHIDDQSGATVTQNINTDKYLKSALVLHLTVSQQVSSGATILIAADTTGAIGVWAKTTKKKFEAYTVLPKYKLLPSALAIDPRGEKVIVTYVDQKVIEYDLVNKRLCPNMKMPKEWYSRNSAVTAISYHPERKNSVIFQDETSLWVLERELSDENDFSEPSPKKSNDRRKSSSLKILPIKYMAGFEWLGSDEAVVIEVLPENIISLLPPVLARKRFQTM